MTDVMIPHHIAIIMDGNRRWAKEHHLPITEGHRRVADRILEPLVEHAAKRGVKYLTFWAWSTENWKRSAEEVANIMGIFRHVIRKQWERLHKKGVCIKIIGNIEQFDEDIKKALTDVVEATRHNTTITTVFALNYGGRDELIRAANKAISHQLSAMSKTNDIHHLAQCCKLNADSFSPFLDTTGIPDPDLIIRTGGQQRLSGFLLWQSEYSELYFPKWYMPDFTSDRLDEAIEEFTRRKRNFGV
jgi:undecaprenyl diphosphate synthase